MSVNLVEYRNKTREDVSMLLGSKRIDVGALSSVLLDESEAELAEMKYPGVLEKVQTEGLGTKKKERKENEPIWLANMSGHPDAPEYYEELKRNRATGLDEVVKVLNELAKPLDYKIRRRNKPEIRVYEGSSLQFKTPKITHSLKYKEVAPVEPSLAKAFLRSTEGLPPQKRGWIIVSRPQDFYKPDRSWNYDEITAWVGLVDKDFDTMQHPTESEIRKNARSGVEADRVLFEAREKMLLRAHFLCADPRFVVPSRKDFEAYMAKDALEKETGTTKTIVETQTKRGPGRPKKSA